MKRLEELDPTTTVKENPRHVIKHEKVCRAKAKAISNNLPVPVVLSF